MFVTVRRGVYALIVVGLLGLNVATLVSVSLFSFVSVIVSSVLDVADLGASTVQARHQQKLVRMQAETKPYVRKAGAMQSEAEQKRRQEKQRAEAAEQRLRLEKQKSEHSPHVRRWSDEEHRETGGPDSRTEHRLYPLEAVPFIGIWTVVGLTYLDLQAVCDTMADMAVIRREFGLETSDDNAPSAYCGGGVPNPAALWQKVPSWSELWDLYWNDGFTDPLQACLSELGAGYPDARATCEEIVQAEAEPEGRSPIPSPDDRPSSRPEPEADRPKIPIPGPSSPPPEAAPSAGPIPTPG